MVIVSLRNSQLFTLGEVGSGAGIGMHTSGHQSFFKMYVLCVPAWNHLLVA